MKISVGALVKKPMALPQSVNRRSDVVVAVNNKT